MTTLPSPAWQPTPRQEAFRELAEALWADGAAGVSVCLRASRLLAQGRALAPSGNLAGLSWAGAPVTAREWRGWERAPEFVAWWAEAFPEIEGPTETDLRQADGLFWAQMVRGLAAGELATMALYARIKAAEQKAHPEKAPGSLDVHFEEPDEADNGWMEPA